MVARAYLSPALFYLQDFNQYRVLALPASEMGNMTLVGRNTAGKTTLANCFYPMLIDGSIATPSFNAAKGTEKLDQSGTVRNSKRETRTFESMLLGWGPGAKKIRTGYACLLLKSQQRQVILGIGAHRATDGSHGQTWWFVVINTDPAAVISLITTDAAGHSLGKAAFIAANAALGEQLRVFTRADDYRAYVADAVYGFDDSNKLSKLANTYRLLASPILTGGSARFQPILAALREAQEPIDAPQVIYPVANSQRELNQLQALLKQIRTAQQLLHKIKAAVFWGNLNHLQDRYVGAYTDLDAQIQQRQTTIGELQQTRQALQEQLTMTVTNLETAQRHIHDLREEQLVQKTIQEKRSQLTERQATLADKIQRYQNKQRELQDLRAAQNKLTTDLMKNERAGREIEKQQLSAVMTTLNSRSANLTLLRQALTKVDRSAQLDALKDYLHQMKHELRTYRQRAATMAQLTQSIKIVNDMQTQMDGAIDQRLTSPLSAHSRDGLHEDNRQIHQGGAAQMSETYDQLKTVTDQQLTEVVDLAAYLKNEALLPQIKQVITDFEDVLNQIIANQTKRTAIIHDQNEKQGYIDRLVAEVNTDFDGFDEKLAATQIEEAHQQLADLVLDPTVDERLSTQEQREKDLRKQQGTFDSKLNVVKGKLETEQSNVDTEQQTLEQMATVIEAALQVLQPYLPDEVSLATVTELLKFEQSNRARIRSYPLTDLGNTIRNAINGADSHQVRVEAAALDTLFESRGYHEIASAMRQQRTVNDHEMTIVAFDINEALSLMAADEQRVAKRVDVSAVGNHTALHTYLIAAIHSINDQYAAVATYNQLLAVGQRGDGIRLKIELQPQFGFEAAIKEARQPQLDERPALTSLIETKVAQFTNDETLAADDEAFLKRAAEMLDIRSWSKFQVMIHRRQSAADEYEVVDDNFVQSGGSGAEKAQAMVLPLLLVPKMLLSQAKQEDAPHLVMFDEFADKLDNETARVFAQTIARFGFSFIATMPSGGQTKILADGVQNIAWEIIAPKAKNDGKFHLNRVLPALIWRPEQ